MTSQDTSRRSLLPLAALLLLPLAACGGGSSNVDSAEASQAAPTQVGATRSVTALYSTASEAAGSNCPNGGTKVTAGADANGSGVLDDSEVTQTQYVCSGANGTQGLSALVLTSAEPAGSNCPNGGTRVTAGLDANGNGVLDSNEMSQVQYVCSGATGPTGAAGAQGDAGPAGAPGANGSDGLTALVSMVSEPAGANCSAGGTKVLSGSDTNRNGTLDSSEVTQTQFVCNAVPGATGATGADGKSALVSLSMESPGANCAYGGTRIDAGTDADGDGTLQASESTSVSYVCAASGGWLVATSDTQTVSNTNYVASSDSSRVLFTLPASPAVGDIVSITGSGSRGWAVMPNAGQSIVMSTISSIALLTTQSTLYGAQYAAVQFQYVGNNQFMPLSYIGNLDNGIIAQGGLLWTPAVHAQSWQAANAYCDGTLYGRSDWRLPTDSELQALAESGSQIDHGWDEDSIPFGWTSVSSSTGSHDIVWFSDRGAVAGFTRPEPDDSPSLDVTCVR